MNQLRKSFRKSLTRKKQPTTNTFELSLGRGVLGGVHENISSRSEIWKADEEAVIAGTCSFPVKYLGSKEVEQSRGMEICEEALKALKLIKKKRKNTECTLFITGDGLRIIEDKTRALIVDQVLDKVSFCAPSQTMDGGFSYICRDVVAQRWICHGFVAKKERGERLCHAVGCAFNLCLDEKRKSNPTLIVKNPDPNPFLEELDDKPQSTDLLLHVAVDQLNLNGSCVSVSGVNVDPFSPFVLTDKPILNTKPLLPTITVATETIFDFSQPPVQPIPPETQVTSATHQDNSDTAIQGSMTQALSITADDTASAAIPAASTAIPAGSTNPFSPNWKEDEESEPEMEERNVLHVTENSHLAPAAPILGSRRNSDLNNPFYSDNEDNITDGELSFLAKDIEMKL